MEDYIIARNKKLKNIAYIAKKIGISNNDLTLYGKYKAKINPISKVNESKLILVTAINPTPFGEGKTTVAIGIQDAMWQSGEKSILVLREPSMGPVFGIKGGATGGGLSQILPMDDINLHFNGDFHAITSANNLICACIDNAIYFENRLNLNPQKIYFNRCLDVNDRVLRNVTIALNNPKNGVERVEHFDITAASEMMAVFCLAKDMKDLRKRIDSIIIGLNNEEEYVYVKDLNITGSVLALLKDAIKPNLVQTLEENPVLVHGGPFANIAHGCNSVIATNTAMSLAPYVITEAGFGADLGAVKFFDIKCRLNNLKPLAVVLVCTIKALKYNGYVLMNQINQINNDALVKGLDNLKIHIENLKKFKVNIIVTLNKYETDDNSEIEIVKNFVEKQDVLWTVNTAYSEGGKGALSIVKAIKSFSSPSLSQVYDINDTIESKIEKVCKNIFRAKEINYSDIAKEKLIKFQEKFGKYPICIAKTQYSITDDKDKLGAPINCSLLVNDVRVYNGAGFITVYLGKILTMPGLSEIPAACKIDIDSNNDIIGIF